MRLTPKSLVQLGTAALSDALGKKGAMDHDMQCRSANPSMAGPAFTVQVHTADILMVIAALSQCPAGHVLVVDGQGELDTALWGELTTYCAAAKGIAGVVIDGAIRDFAKVSKHRLPVFARAIVPSAGGANYLGDIGVSVSCGGQVVNPGDWIVGDLDGVVVIPKATLEEAAAVAGQIVRAERTIEQAVLNGVDLGDLLQVSKAIARKRSEMVVPQLSVEPKPAKPRKTPR